MYIIVQFPISQVKQTCFFNSNTQTRTSISINKKQTSGSIEKSYQTVQVNNYDFVVKNIHNRKNKNYFLLSIDAEGEEERIINQVLISDYKPIFLIYEYSRINKKLEMNNYIELGQYSNNIILINNLFLENLLFREHSKK